MRFAAVTAVGARQGRGSVVRLISWNIQWARGRDGRVDPLRVAHTLFAHDPDLVCLQEVAVNHPGLPGGAGMDQVALFGGLFTGFETAFGVASDLPDGLGGRRLFGNMVISRHPILQVFRHALPFPPDPAVPAMARAALEVVIDAPGGPLRVVTTHLEYYSTTQRAAQIAALRAIHAAGCAQAIAPHATGEADPPFAVLPRGEHTVFCGDFNCAPDAPEMRGLLAPDGGGAVPSGLTFGHGGTPEFPPGLTPDPIPRAAEHELVDAWTARHGRLPHAPTAGFVSSRYFPVPTCYDRCYLSAGLRPRLREISVDSGADGSDHQPVILDID